MRRKSVEKLTIVDCERAIRIPSKKWHGRCYEVACAIVGAGLVKGRAVYGHYRGPVARTGYWKDRRELSFIQHGWIILADDRVLDPTRWSFEDKSPYLALFEPGFSTACAHCGHCDEEHGMQGRFLRSCASCPGLEGGVPACSDFEPERTPFDDYDEGGNELRETMERPVPPYRKGAREITLKLPPLVRVFILGLLENPAAITIDHVFWLGNLSLRRLGPYAKDIYKAIARAGEIEVIPIDNRFKVLGETRRAKA